MTTIDDRVLEIAETAAAMIADRNETELDNGFQHFIYEQTTEFLIELDQAFKGQQASQALPKLSLIQKRDEMC